MADLTKTTVPTTIKKGATFIIRWMIGGRAAKCNIIFTGECRKIANETCGIFTNVRTQKEYEFTREGLVILCEYGDKFTSDLK